MVENNLLNHGVMSLEANLALNEGTLIPGARDGAQSK